MAHLNIKIMTIEVQKLVLIMSAHVLYETNHITAPWIIVKNSATFLLFDFLGFFRKIWISADYLNKIIELTNKNKCSSSKSVIKCCYVGYRLFSNFDFHVTHKKSKDTGSTKEDVFYTFTSGNSQNIFTCVIFHCSGCVFMG